MGEGRPICIYFVEWLLSPFVLRVYVRACVCGCMRACVRMR